MTTPRSFTLYFLAAFFTAILLVLVAASAWSHERASQAAQTAATDTYLPADEDTPVTDTVIEKNVS